MLQDLRTVLGDRHAVVLREMTKVYEEIQRGPVSRLLEGLPPERPRGEFTLVVEGASRPDDESEEALRPEEIEARLNKRSGTVKELAAELAQERGLPFRRVYRLCLAKKRDMEQD